MGRNGRAMRHARRPDLRHLSPTRPVSPPGAAPGNRIETDAAVALPPGAKQPAPWRLDGVGTRGIEPEVVGEVVPPFEPRPGGVRIEIRRAEVPGPALPRVTAVSAKTNPLRPSA